MTRENDPADLNPLDYDMDGDGYINRDWLIDPTGVFYVKRIAIAANNDPNLKRDASGCFKSNDDIDGDGILNADDTDDDNDGMKDSYEISYGVANKGWQNPFIYNARYAVLVTSRFLLLIEKSVKFFLP